MMRPLSAVLIMLLMSVAVSVSGLQSTAKPRESQWPEEFFAKADSAGADGMYRMALLLEDGTPVYAPDSASALRLLQRSAALGLPAALNYLGFKYIKGEGVEHSPERGLNLIKEAAAAGDPKSLNNLGWLYLTGEYVERDPRQAVIYLDRAAKAGLPAAAATLADMYVTGKDIPADTLRADSLYLAASDAGFTDAQYRLLAVHRATLDALSADSAFVIGAREYAKGRHILAYPLIKRGAMDTIPRAMALLAHAYSTGLGIPYDHTMANRWFYLAAEAGDPSAQFIIAEMLEVFPDALAALFPDRTDIIDDARYWYRRAEEGGVDNADEAITRLININNNCIK